MNSPKFSCGCRSGGMFTIDRINRLRRYYDLTPLTTVQGVDLHAALDVLDGAAKLLTRPENSQMRRSVTLSKGQHGAQWYVGARLARLEDKVFRAPVYLQVMYANGTLSTPDREGDEPIGSDFWSDEDWHGYHLNRPEGNFVAEPPSGAFSFWLGEMG